MNLNPLYPILRMRQLRDAEAAAQVAQMRKLGQLVHVRRVTQAASTGTKALVDVSGQGRIRDAWFKDTRVANDWVYAARHVSDGYGPHTQRAILYISSLASAIPAKTLRAAERHERRLVREIDKDVLIVPPEWANANLRHPSGTELKPEPGVVERFYTNTWQGRRADGRTILRPYIFGRTWKRPWRLTWPTALTIVAAHFIYLTFMYKPAETQLIAKYPGLDFGNPRTLPPQPKADVTDFLLLQAKGYLTFVIAAALVSMLVMLVCTRGWTRARLSRAENVRPGERIKVPKRAGFVAKVVSSVTPLDHKRVVIELQNSSITVRASKKLSVVELSGD